MAIIHIEGEATRKTTRHPTRCVECPMFMDDTIPWCVFYRKRTSCGIRPEFCKVVGITIVEEE